MATPARQHATVTLRLRRTFPAPRERVFRAWTTPEEMKQARCIVWSVSTAWWNLRRSWCTRGNGRTTRASSMKRS